MISQKVDAICICMIDPGAMDPILKKALDQGIVVISHEAATAENVLFDLEAFSNEDYGAKLMDLMAEAMGEQGNYATTVSYTHLYSRLWGGSFGRFDICGFNCYIYGKSECNRPDSYRFWYRFCQFYRILYAGKKRKQQSEAA